MKLRALITMFWAACSIVAFSQTILVKKLDRYTNDLSQEFSTISSERKTELLRLADQIILSKANNEVANVVFKSDNNSTESQLSQAWLQVAIAKLNINGIQVYSAGVNEQSISKTVINALKSSGFKISDNVNYIANKRYLVSYSWDANSILMFSKKSDNFQIPTTQILSVNVNETDLQDNAVQISKQIATEMFFLADKIQSSHLLSLQR